MTICVRIENRDNREEKVIAIRAIDPATNAPFPHGLNVTLKGGESREVFIHDSMGVAVTEVSQ